MAIGYKEQSAASVQNAPTGAQYTFIDSSDGRLKRKNSAGVVVDIEAADAGITQITGEVLVGPGTGVQPGTISNAAVIAKVMTGLAETYGVPAAADSILQAISKLAYSQALMANEINVDLTIPANHTMVRGKTILTGTATLTIASGATLHIL